MVCQKIDLCKRSGFLMNVEKSSMENFYSLELEDDQIEILQPTDSRPQFVSFSAVRVIETDRTHHRFHSNIFHNSFKFRFVQNFNYFAKFNQIIVN